jgi:hypothetical protein
MIEPGIGRIVHFYPAGHAPGDLPHAAMIVGIRDARTINLAIFTPEGHQYRGLDVLLIQDDSDVRPTDRGYAEWMPFQKGQAAKTDALQAQLATAAPAPAPAPQPAPAPAQAPAAPPVAAAPQPAPAPAPAAAQPAPAAPAAAQPAAAPAPQATS